MENGSGMVENSRRIFHYLAGIIFLMTLSYAFGFYKLLFATGVATLSILAYGFWGINVSQPPKALSKEQEQKKTRYPKQEEPYHQKVFSIRSLKELKVQQLPRKILLQTNKSSNHLLLPFSMHLNILSLLDLKILWASLSGFFESHFDAPPDGDALLLSHSRGVENA